MNALLKSLAPRIIQDVVTTGAGYLAAHGYLAADQQQAFIGSIFFLVMLVVNGGLHFSRQNASYAKGVTDVVTSANEQKVTAALNKAQINPADIGAIQLKGK